MRAILGRIFVKNPDFSTKWMKVPVELYPKYEKNSHKTDSLNFKESSQDLLDVHLDHSDN